MRLLLSLLVLLLAACGGTEDTSDAACTPACDGRACGDDGCGGSCGTCEAGASCDGAGQCVPACTPDCEGRFCGDDGCGGSCGTCGDGESCQVDIGRCAGCTPECGDRACGDDGCGGTCGTCGEGEICDPAGACVAAGTSLRQDVMPILQANCNACHAGARPSEGLSFATADLAYEGMVERPSAGCAGRTIVVPGDADGSYLIAKLGGGGDFCGFRMPQGRPPLSAAQIGVIRDWIEAGAKND